MSGAPVMILAGGTGGHIFPGIAVGRELVARGVPVVWLGSEVGLENTLVPKAGFPLERIRVSGLRGKGALALLVAPFRLLRAVWQARAVVRRVAPRAVLAMGGFASGPGGVASWLLGRPLLVHEQNRVPGYTNRLLAMVARRVMVGFPDAFGTRRVDAVGNPVRADIAAIPAPAERLVDRQGALRLLVLGGSQGARGLNLAVPKALAALPATLVLEVRHQAGGKMIDDARRAYADAGVGADVVPFIDDMAAAYAWADLIVCRSGALTVAELCAAGVGSVLVPFPAAVDDHQARNAEFLVTTGAAEMLREGADLAERIAAVLARLLGDRSRLTAMAVAARALARPQATGAIADACLEEARA
jgi:UDP-N-acetylglucosamine--N-acetylmuramyl-(pentapeptide) pyrophosphoryl-undecaprenol N-acetylglucosamine transferase